MLKLRTGKLVMSFMFIFLAAGNGFCTGVDSEGWTLLREGLYINEKSLSRSAGDKVSLWVKIVPDEDSALMYDARSHLMQDGKVYQALKYDYTGLLSEIDCPGKRYRKLITIMYDVNKNIVDSEETSADSWQDIPSEGNLALVLTAACN